MSAKCKKLISVHTYEIKVSEPKDRERDAGGESGVAGEREGKQGCCSGRDEEEEEEQCREKEQEEI